MATVKFLVEETSASITSSGAEVVEQYLVTDLGGPEPGRAWLATQQSGIPRYGDRHPTVPGVSVDSISVRPETDSPKTFRVAVTSRRPVIDSSDSGDEDEIDDQDYGSLEFFYLTRDVETQFDADGDQITVAHTFGEDDPHGRSGLTITQGGTIQIQTWQQGIRFSRRESESPASLQGVYGSRLNRSAWNGYDPLTVMCVGIDGSTDDGGVTWQVNYSFMLDPYSNWKKDVVFSDEERSGDPPPGLVRDVGYKTLAAYQTIDFAPLSIDFSRMRRKPSGGRRGRSPIGYPLFL